MEDPANPADYVKAVLDYTSRTPETFVLDDVAEPQYNGDVWSADPKLLWTNDNPDFLKLIGAKPGGGKDDSVDTSMEDWMAQAPPQTCKSKNGKRDYESSCLFA